MILDTVEALDELHGGVWIGDLNHAGDPAVGGLGFGFLLGRMATGGCNQHHRNRG